MPRPEWIDLTGKTIANWRFLEYVGSIKRLSIWKVECLLCGKIYERGSNGIRYGSSTKCIDCARKAQTVPENERKCKWCGGPPAAAQQVDRKAQRECMACGKTKSRRGTYPCGKPKRAFITFNPVDEHLCSECEIWKKPKTLLNPCVGSSDPRARRCLPCHTINRKCKLK